MNLSLLYSELQSVIMSGIKRTIEETDPDYEDVSVALPNKRHKAIENSGRNLSTLRIASLLTCVSYLRLFV